MTVRTSGEEDPRKGQGLKKECETKDDGRYIIFYTFPKEEVGEDEPSDEEGEVP